MMRLPVSSQRTERCPDSAIGIETIKEMVSIGRTLPMGNIVEVGVWRGGCAWHLAGLALDRNVQLHLFDTFTGIPVRDEIDIHQIGDFGDTDAEKVMAAIPSAFFHIGIFPETLPDNIGLLSLVHVDCDQYRSVKACIEYLSPLMLSGGKMFFDDYGMVGVQQAIRECGYELPLRTGHAAPCLTF